MRPGTHHADEAARHSLPRPACSQSPRPSVRPAMSPQRPTPRAAEIAPLATKSLLLDAAIAGTRIVVVGERGQVLLSDDQGAAGVSHPCPRAPFSRRLLPRRAPRLGGRPRRGHPAQRGWRRALGARALCARRRSSHCLMCGFATPTTVSPSAPTEPSCEPSDGGRTWSEQIFEPQPLDPKPAAAQAAQTGGRRVRRRGRGKRHHLNAVAAFGRRQAVSRRGSGSSRSAPTTAARPGSSCPRPTRDRSSACCRSIRHRCWPLACAATCSARTMPAPPGTRLRPTPRRC